MFRTASHPTSCPPPPSLSSPEKCRCVVEFGLLCSTYLCCVLSQQLFSCLPNIGFLNPGQWADDNTESPWTCVLSISTDKKAPKYRGVPLSIGYFTLHHRQCPKSPQLIMRTLSDVRDLIHPPLRLGTCPLARYFLFGIRSNTHHAIFIIRYLLAAYMEACLFSRQHSIPLIIAVTLAMLAAAIQATS